MGYECRILADSVNVTGQRITTLQVKFPRIVLPELSRHRVFSFNSASSRAIPSKKLIDAVDADPFAPAEWRANQRGMSAGDVISEANQYEADLEWNKACDNAVNSARILAGLGVHKQWTNRLIEPFMWVEIVLTSTQWKNFFALRCHDAAQPEIRTIAEMIRDEMATTTPRKLNPGEWHVPFGSDYAELSEKLGKRQAQMVAAGRIARISYLTHDGKRNYDEDLRLANDLVNQGHWSPFEHLATAWDFGYRFANLKGWRSLRMELDTNQE